ncbi:vacuolar fusion protein MON1 homolog A-like [Ornithodoros turicata]|uniref:vacuolar fusion protein MON1 homolog A-like n=1 Tax=Ornithodoros turicata TaxID=34597 RepID=UPI0031399B3E
MAASGAPENEVVDITSRLLDEEIDFPKDFEPGASKVPIISSVDSSSDLEISPDAQYESSATSPSGRQRSSISEIGRSTSLEADKDAGDTNVEASQAPYFQFSEDAEQGDNDNLEEASEDEDCNSEEWQRKKKHIFVLSEAGKPIYTRHGNEERLVTLMGVLQALVSSVAVSGDQIRFVKAGGHRLAFLLRLPLILVAATTLPLSFQQLLSQLNYIHAQIISILSASQLARAFEHRHNFDLRRLLAGSERFLDSLCDLMDEDPSFLLGAVRCLPLPSDIRDTITQTIAQCCSKLKNLVFAVLVAENHIVALVGMKQYQLHHHDIHLIFNMVHASESFKAAESWTPICLPKFDPSGFLHAHVSYLAENCPACLLLLTIDRDMFFPLQECRRNITDRLRKHHCLEAIGTSLKAGGYSVSEVGVPTLSHFVYKSKSTAQLTSPPMEAPYNTADERERLLGFYHLLHHRMYQPECPLKILYFATDREILLGWHMAGFELYASFEPLVTKETAVHAMTKLVQWIKKEENRLFIMSSVTL